MFVALAGGSKGRFPGGFVLQGGLAAGGLALRAVVGHAGSMELRPLCLSLALGIALGACNQRRTADAGGVASASSAVPTAPVPREDAPPEDTSHDAPPPAEDVVVASPAASVAPEAKPEAPLRTQGIEKAVADLAAWATRKGGALGAAILDVRDDRRLVEVNAEKPLNPASNQKILTAAAALHYLGPAYRFRTELRGSSEAGVAESLVLSGNGDPSLATHDLWRLARVARERGLQRVGTIYVDQSHFDDQYVPPAFEQQPDEWAAFRAPVSAVSIEQNTITLNVAPNAPTEPATFWFEPPGVVDSHGAIETRARGSGDGVRWSLLVDNPARATRPRSVVSGGLAAGLGRRRYTRRMEDPRLAPGHALRQVLADLGVETTGDVRLGSPKSKAAEVLSYVLSEPLGQLLYPVGKDSDNFYAETLLKALGAAAASGEKTGSDPGSSAAGARAVLGWLERARIDTQGVVIRNGSGLFDANRVSPAVLAQALAAAQREPAIASEMAAQLAIGGVDGTLRNRFQKLAQRRVVRAKTGTLRNVIALSGYVMGPSGRPPVAFSLLVVGVPAAPGEARRRADRVVDEIAAALWPRSE